jgi:hypothetical protein
MASVDEVELVPLDRATADDDDDVETGDTEQILQGYRHRHRPPYTNRWLVGIVAVLIVVVATFVVDYFATERVVTIVIVAAGVCLPHECQPRPTDAFCGFDALGAGTLRYGVQDGPSVWSPSLASPLPPHIAYLDGQWSTGGAMRALVASPANTTSACCATTTLLPLNGCGKRLPDLVDDDNRRIVRVLGVDGTHCVVAQLTPSALGVACMDTNLTTMVLDGEPALELLDAMRCVHPCLLVALVRSGRSHALQLIRIDHNGRVILNDGALRPPPTGAPGTPARMWAHDGRVPPRLYQPVFVVEATGPRGWRVLATLDFGQTWSAERPLSLFAPAQQQQQQPPHLVLASSAVAYAVGLDARPSRVATGELVSARTCSAADVRPGCVATTATAVANCTPSATALASSCVRVVSRRDTAVLVRVATGPFPTRDHGPTARDLVVELDPSGPSVPLGLSLVDNERLVAVLYERRGRELVVAVFNESSLALVGTRRLLDEYHDPVPRAAVAIGGATVVYPRPPTIDRTARHGVGPAAGQVHDETFRMPLVIAVIDY